MPKNNNENKGLGQRKFDLEKLFQDIKENSKSVVASETSYTNFLINAGPEKIAKKIIEEAFEVGIAGVEGPNHKSDKQQIILESADLIYHLLVLMVSRKVELSDVISELEKRSAISGNRKDLKKK